MLLSSLVTLNCLLFASLGDSTGYLQLLDYLIHIFNNILVNDDLNIIEEHSTLDMLWLFIESNPGHLFLNQFRLLKPHSCSYTYLYDNPLFEHLL